MRPLHPAPTLMTAAREHATDMMRRDYIAMESPDGTSLADRAGGSMRGAHVAAYRETGAELAAELLAGDTGTDCDLTTIGVGRAVGGKCGFYWAVIVGVD
ncbi:CAP domain-containing protein [Actinokineospora soli]|uniref:CAP domain-containing protein n=1 Tax=Actinokineospora soli TaxID=1048753 RepID=A0ABW2TPS8_9PSEU